MKKYVTVLLITCILLAIVAYYEPLIARTATNTISSRQDVPNPPVIETPVETSTKMSNSCELFDDWNNLSGHVNESIVAEGNLSGSYVWLDMIPTPSWNYWLYYDGPSRVGVLWNNHTEYNLTRVRIYGIITQKVWWPNLNCTFSWCFITAERIEAAASISQDTTDSPSQNSQTISNSSTFGIMPANLSWSELLSTIRVIRTNLSFPEIESALHLAPENETVVIEGWIHGPMGHICEDAPPWDYEINCNGTLYGVFWDGQGFTDYTYFYNDTYVRVWGVVTKGTLAGPSFSVVYYVQATRIEALDN